MAWFSVLSRKMCVRVYGCVCVCVWGCQLIPSKKIEWRQFGLTNYLIVIDLDQILFT